MSSKIGGDMMPIEAPHFPEGTILMRRPLYELACLEIPSLQLIISVVKTCVMAIFRHHFYDLDTMIMKTTHGFTHNLSGKFEQARAIDPKVFRCVVAFVPRDVFKEGSVNFTNAADHYKGSYPFYTTGFALFKRMDDNLFVEERAQLV